MSQNETTPGLVPDPAVVRDVLGAVFAVEEVSTWALEKQVSTPSPGFLELQQTLEWLDSAGVIQQVGPESWRAPDDLFNSAEPALDELRFASRPLHQVIAWARNQTASTDVFEMLAFANECGSAAPKSVRDALQAMRAEATSISADRSPQYDLLREFRRLEERDELAWEHYERVRLNKREDRVSAIALSRDLGAPVADIRSAVKACDRLLDLLVKSNPDSGIASVAERLKSLGPVMTASELDDFFGALGRGNEAFRSRPSRRQLVLDLALPGASDSGEWILSEQTKREIVGHTRGLFGPDSLVVPRQLVEESLTGFGIRRAVVDSWIDAQSNLDCRGDQVLYWEGSMADKGVALLEFYGVPMTLEDLFESSGIVGRNPRSFYNQLQGDPRILRRGVKHYGLLSWGGEEYTKLTEEMEQEIERQGGMMSLELLSTQMAENFGASESSVRMYASAHPFVVDGNGIIRVSNDEATLPSGLKALELCGGLFKVDGNWALRRVVDHDVARGSGSSIPLSLAAELGLKPGESLDFESPYGTINVAWRSHMANIGSLRKIVLDEDLVEGDIIFVIHENDRFGIRIIKQAELSGLDGESRLAAECGNPTANDPRVQIGLALGFGAASDAVSVRSRLNARREPELAELVSDTEDGTDLLDQILLT